MNVPQSTLLGASLALVAAFSVAGTTIAVRLGTRDGHSSDALLIILFVNVVVFVPLAIGTSTSEYTPSLTPLLSFVAAGLIGTLFARIIYYASIERIGASRSEPIKASQPLHATLIAVLVLGETVGTLHALGILLIVLGGVLVTLETSNDSVGLENVSPTALILPFSAAFLFGLEPIFAKIGLNAGISVFVGLAIKTLSAIIGYTVYLHWRNALSLTTTSRSSFIWYLVAGISNSIFLLSYYVALEFTPVTVVLPIMQTSPIFVVGLAFVFLRDYERVTWQLVSAALVVMGGGAMVTLFG